MWKWENVLSKWKERKDDEKKWGGEAALYKQKELTSFPVRQSLNWRCIPFNVQVLSGFAATTEAAEKAPPFL